MKLVHINRNPCEQVVKMLEEALEDARRGDIRALGFFDPDVVAEK